MVRITPRWGEPPSYRKCNSASLAAAIAEKPAARYMIRNRIRVVKRHPEGDW
jgi:hypothetical protein